METRLRLQMLPQPDDSTCGATCLQAIYDFYADPVALSKVVDEVVHLETGGTLAVWLACHALRRGYDATIYTYNLQLFDPTWFGAEKVDIASKLRAQRSAKSHKKFEIAVSSYSEFLSLGGKLAFQEMKPGLIRRYLNRQTPLLCGLSATYLYGCTREYDDQYDDIRGDPAGHFVVLCGYSKKRREVLVADPLHDNPAFRTRIYEVGIDRLIGAILLGVLTHDANMLVVEPKKPRLPRNPSVARPPRASSQRGKR